MILIILFFIAVGIGLGWSVFLVFGENIAHVVAGPVGCLTAAIGLVVAVRIEKYMTEKGF